VGGDLEERAQAFLDKAKEDPQWAQDSITYFLVFHKQRVDNSEDCTGNFGEFLPSNKIIL
jgi:hypothetical protein